MDVISFAFGIDQRALLNLIYQHRLTLSQHCVATKNPRYIHYKAYFISFMLVTTFPHNSAFLSPFKSIEVFSTASICTDLDVSPTYFYLQAWQTNSYVTPVLLHDPFPSVRQRRQSALTHRLCLNGSDLCSMALRVVSCCSTALILNYVALISVMYRRLSWEPGVAGTKITVSKSPFLNQLSRFLFLSRARSNALHRVGLYNGFSPLASSSNNRL